VSELGYALLVIDEHGPGAEPEAGPSFIEALFASQGVSLDVSRWQPGEAAGADERAARLAGWLAATDLDRERSAVVGATDIDRALAKRLGLGFVGLGGGYEGSWPWIARSLSAAPRRATVARTTRETRIRATVDLDREGPQQVRTGIGFFDHMLEQIAKHGGFALELDCEGDLHVDEHHTVEDCALALGEAMRRALGDKRGIGRYGFVLPMDEAQAQVAVDLGGRAYLVFDGRFPRDRVGELSTEMVPHFFRSLADTLGASIRIEVDGDNAHHMVEASFKGVGRALRPALAVTGHDLPSTKGLL
jgi:imidazoleglycerol-phosphate dehydratase/histidinol-phosphatase